MSKIEDGGPAFPSRRDIPYPTGGFYRDDRPGMTLRDYFAAKALNGMLSNDSDDEFYSSDFSEVTRRYAQMAYQYADAMLRARNNHGGE